jgi:DNA segregation ATPase FtsK/SpoIIIE, S-DNA-T family
MARVRATLERAATLHRQAVAAIDAAAHDLDAFTPNRSPAALEADLRKLVDALTEAAQRTAPDWLGGALDDALADLPTGTASGAIIPVRIGAAYPAADLSFPVVVPFLGRGSLAIETTPDSRAVDLLRCVLLRLVAGTTPGSLRVRAIDPTGVAFTSFAPLFDGRVMPPPVTDRAGLRMVMAEAEQWLRTPPQPGRHLLLAVAALPARADAADLARLHAIAEQGPEARVSVVVIGDITLPNATRVTFDGLVGMVSDPPGESFGQDDMLPAPVHVDGDPPAALVSEVCAKVAAQAQAADALSLSDLLPGEIWQGDPAPDLAATIGMAGVSPLNLRLGDLTPHWLIGGRSGAGKTALLINLLYGLCSTYAPDDLTLYLLDLKEGTSFREFMPTDRDPTWIPHTRSVGVEADRAYGLAVLHELEAEMARREELFAAAETNRFAEYRAHARLPRIVCVIDEFPTLLIGDDRIARHAATALGSIARKGRLYGVHLILASQTLRGIESLLTRRDSFFSQFAVRIALPGGADVLDVRNEAAAALRLGTAIVNTAGGLGGPSGAARAHERLVEFPDPYGEPKVLTTLRRRLFLTRPAGAQPPYVFRGSTPARLPLKITKGRRPSAYLGHAVDVPLTPVTFAFDPAPGRHVAVIGPSEVGADLLDAAARSLAAQHAIGAVRFVVAPVVAAADEVGTLLAADLAQAGHVVESADADRLRATLADQSMRDTYVIGFGMDGVGDNLRWLLRDGPMANVHLIGWWRSLRRFGEDAGGSDGPDNVAGLVLLNVPAAEVAMFLDQPDLDWQPRANRALAHDRHASLTQVIVPYVRRGRR